jgi:WD40 repeat protein
MLWEPASGRELLQLKGHTEPVHDVDFSHDGRLLASVSAYGTLKLWSALPGREIQRYPGLPWELAHTSDGRKVANAYLMDQIAVRDPQSGQLLAQLRRQRRTTTALTISPDDRYLAAGDTLVRLPSGSSPRADCCGPGEPTSSLSPKSPIPGMDDSSSVPAGMANSACGMRRALGNCGRSNWPRMPEFFDISPDGRRLATGFGNALRLWNLETGQCERELPGHSELVYFA